MSFPSVSQLKQALKIAEKLESMEAELASILGESSAGPKAKKGPGRPKKAKREMSPEAREKIAAAQRKRWAKAKKAGMQ
ncbi:MAG: hypothetical protein JSR64_15805 [Nitrospira sp.]|nr:hypothetical protein [Nitrospira sp.]